MVNRTSGPRPPSDSYTELHKYYSGKQKSDREIFVIKSGSGRIETHSYNKFHAVFANIYHKLFSEGQVFRGNKALEELENAAKEKFEHQITDFKRMPLGESAKETGERITKELFLFASEGPIVAAAPLQEMAKEVTSRLEKNTQFEEFEKQLNKEFATPSEGLEYNLKFLSFLQQNRSEVDPGKFEQYQATLKNKAEKYIRQIGEQVKIQGHIDAKSAVEVFTKGHTEMEKAAGFGIPVEPLKEGLQALQKRMVESRKSLHDKNRGKLEEEIKTKRQQIAGNDKKIAELEGQVETADRQLKEFQERRGVILSTFAALSENPLLASQREDINHHFRTLNSDHVTTGHLIEAEAFIKQLRDSVASKMPRDIPGAWNSDQEAKKLAEVREDATDKLESLQFYKRLAPQAKVVKGEWHGAIKEGFSDPNLRNIRGLNIPGLKADEQYKELQELLNSRILLGSKMLPKVADLITDLTRKFPQLRDVQQDINRVVYNAFSRQVDRSEESYHQVLLDFKNFQRDTGDGALRKAIQRSIDVADSETMSGEGLQAKVENSRKLSAVLARDVKKTQEELGKDILGAIDNLKKINPNAKLPALVKQRGESDDRFFGRVEEALKDPRVKEPMVSEMLKPHEERLKKLPLSPENRQKNLDVQKELIQDQLNALALQINILHENKAAKDALRNELEAVIPVLDEMDQLIKDTQALPERNRERAVGSGEIGRLRDENARVSGEIKRHGEKLNQMQAGRGIFDIGADVILTPAALGKFVSEADQQLTFI